MEKEPEIWKPIPDYEGLYEASNHGRVKSLSHFRKHHKGGLSHFKERFLTEKINACGYVQFKLSKLGSLKTYKAHRLVADLFVLNPLNRIQVNHIDGNKSNNYYKNLEWVSNRENVCFSIDKDKTASKLIGVSFVRNSNRKKRWKSEVRILGKRKHLGYFYTEEEAHQAYLDALKRYNLKNKYATKPSE